MIEIMISSQKYHERYQSSIHESGIFWDNEAQKELFWHKPYTQTLVWEAPEYRWFVEGELNITYNCLDRHVLSGRGDHTAYIFVNERDEEVRISFRQLLSKVQQMANFLQKRGVQQGDRVALYMPTSIEAIIVMLACARMGAIHSLVYAGLSAQALAARIEDAGAKMVFTTTSTQKSGKKHDLLSVVRGAAERLPFTLQVVVARRPTDHRPHWQPNEIDMELFEQEPADFSPVWVESSHPLFILYTSGTTGSPKGIVHGHGGYSLYAHVTMRDVFALHEESIHWTTADIGWITGHSYVVYGALSNGITSIIYEGSPVFPHVGRYWELIERYKVQSFYTSPTALRLLMREGDAPLEKYDLSSLQILGSVGEPINPAAWEWYSRVVGKGRLPIVDTWWQTETGGHMVVTLPGMPQKAGTAGWPYYGVELILLDEQNQIVTEPNTIGQVFLGQPWPGALLDCWNNHERFLQYWQIINGRTLFATGDMAQWDEQGRMTFLGRADDVVNVAGMRVGTAEVESALVSHDAVVEAAVIAVPDELRGEAIVAFVVLAYNETFSPALELSLKRWVKDAIGYIAVPSVIQSRASLPKTRSGKIVRRLLKAQYLGFDVGDTSTLDE